MPQPDGPEPFRLLRFYETMASALVLTAFPRLLTTRWSRTPRQLPPAPAIDTTPPRTEDRRMKKLGAVLLLAMACGIGWRALTYDAPDTKLIFDRFWVDH